ncbi:Acyl carrier protein [Actinokineospora alba]|uniref:Acyl carrier protein n=1 Tax=Actinokineospora alba TaxID=504798 RepID=A0A1H0FV43_9PSEU|nr:phosphopantetheine-binding protein [Actinokineospora alba]TDP69631.1 acyl carrier protein [Actinokineospora alba]SDI12559.1 Acyl carrier protein [Actinokineospora alba]SDN98485.1 Acyl carrier protein [Actinokineospora alba]
MPDPVAESDSVVEAKARIRALLVDMLGPDSFVTDLSDTVSLRQGGVSSTALVSLLVAMEDEFGFEWQDDVAPEALRSISSLAGHVASLPA